MADGVSAERGTHTTLLQIRDGCWHATTDGVRTERGAHRTLLQILDGCWKRAGAQDDGQVIRRFLAKIALDETLIVDATVDYRCGVHAVFEHDGHLPMDVLLGEGAETVCAFGRKTKVDLKLAGIVTVAIFRSAPQIAAGNHRRAAQNIPNFSAACVRI